MPVLWLDRHLHKNGGSTMREVMLRNEEAGNCLYWGYALTNEGWASVMQYLRSVNSSHQRLPSLCMEEHASTASVQFILKHLPQLIELRAHYQRHGVRLPIVLTTRVREPLSYYLSFYRWRVRAPTRRRNGRR